VSERIAAGNGRILQSSFMKNSNSTNSQSSPHSAVPQDMGFSPWQRLKSKRISYLTLPLIIMATVVEFVILATVEISAHGLRAPSYGGHFFWHRNDRRDHAGGGVAQTAPGR